MIQAMTSLPLSRVHFSDQKVKLFIFSADVNIPRYKYVPRIKPFPCYFDILLAQTYFDTLKFKIGELPDETHLK